MRRRSKINTSRAHLQLNVSRSYHSKRDAPFCGNAGREELHVHLGHTFQVVSPKLPTLVASKTHSVTLMPWVQKHGGPPDCTLPNYGIRTKSAGPPRKSKSLFFFTQGGLRLPHCIGNDVNAAQETASTESAPRPRLRIMSIATKTLAPGSTHTHRKRP